MKSRLFYVLITCTILYFPHLVLAQPNMGTAANYVLFTTTGAVSNTGISQYTGNVGTNSLQMTCI